MTMDRRTTSASLIVAGLVMAIPVSGMAAGFLGGSDELDPSFCGAHTIRPTVVYIDDTDMVDHETDWAVKLTSKLKATLIPSERVTVIKLSPESGQSHEIWTGCWPDYGPNDRAKLVKGSLMDLVRKSPLAQLAEQQRFFSRDFGHALSTIYDPAKRAASDVAIDPQAPPKKEIIRALASDEGRFAHSDQTIRAIVFSDMAENSDLGSALKPLPEPAPGFGKKLGTYLRHSVFYAYGMGSHIIGGSSVQDNERAFWSSALRSMSATVGGLGSELNVANATPIEAHNYTIELSYEGQSLDGRLALLIDRDGVLVDSWIGISRLSSASLTGSFRCQGGPLADPCKLDAETTSGVVTTGPTESVALVGTEKHGLTGTLGVKGSSANFKLNATAVGE
jgi:hypothetical protein